MSNKSTILFLIILLFLCSYSEAKMKTKTKLRSKSFLKEIINATASQAFCFLNSNGTVYDLNPIHNDISDYVISENNYKIDFNVCKNAISKCGNRTGLITYKSKNLDEEECILLAGAGSVVSTWTILSDTVTNKTSLQVELPLGDKCKQDESKNYTTTMLIECDETATTPIVSTNSLNINSCKNTIKLSSISACPKFNVYSFWNAIMNNKYIFGSLIILGGLFFCFFGIKFIYVTEILAGVLGTSFVMLFLLFSYLQIQYSTLEFWLIIGVSSLLGIIVGYIIASFKKVPVVILGAFLGYIISMFLYQLVLKYVTLNPQVVYWLTMFSCIFVVGLLAWFFYDHILILSTSFIGAYAIVRGVSFMAGGFPDEKQIIDLITLGEWNQLNDMLSPIIYAYLSFILVLGLVGTFIQYKYFYESEDDKKKREENEKTEKGPVEDSSATKKLLN